MKNEKAHYAGNYWSATHRANISLRDINKKYFCGIKSWLFPKEGRYHIIGFRLVKKENFK